jgi:hypothetical protein
MKMKYFWRYREFKFQIALSLILTRDKTGTKSWEKTSCHFFCLFFCGGDKAGTLYCVFQNRVFYWHETTHPFLQKRLETEHNMNCVVYQCIFHPGIMKLLRDNQIQGSAVFPFAAYIEFILAAASRKFGVAVPLSISAVSMTSPIVLGEFIPR